MLFRSLNEEQFKKIIFVSVDEIHNLDNKKFDLGIQIDGFNEMTLEVVKHYISFIDKRCNNFYVKNPVGKYFDKEILKKSSKKSINLALQSGILTDVVDINDNKKIKEASLKFIEVYRPSLLWKELFNNWSKPTSFMWECFYTKNE